MKVQTLTEKTPIAETFQLPPSYVGSMVSSNTGPQDDISPQQDF